MTVSEDALGCECLVVATKNGYMDLFNISKGFKQFTYVMAYADNPVYKVLTYMGLFGIDKGMITVGNDGCISVWQWKKPNNTGANRGGKSRGRGGYRGRGGGRGGQGRGETQGGQGRGMF
jgi:hypothetical protein